jgi:hypothetical protein
VLLLLLLVWVVGRDAESVVERCSLEHPGEGTKPLGRNGIMSGRGPEVVSEETRIT